MGLYPSDDRCGRRIGPCSFGIHFGSPSCEIVISSTLSHHLQRYMSSPSEKFFLIIIQLVFFHRWSQSRLRQWRTPIATIFNQHDFRSVGSHVPTSKWSSRSYVGIRNSSAQARSSFHEQTTFITFLSSGIFCQSTSFPSLKKFQLDPPIWWTIKTRQIFLHTTTIL